MNDAVMEELSFDEKGLIPVIAQDDETNEVLMLAYMNKEALEKSIKTGMAHYWSRSRKKIWLKGETSGHFQYIKSISMDCDGDALLMRVEQREAACHTGNYSCFFRKLSEKENSNEGRVLPDAFACDGGMGDGKSTILQELYDVILDRSKNPKEGSYTGYLFDKGLDKMLKKVGEEAAEVIIAAKNKDKKEITYEISDLLYHVFVVMVESGIKLDDIYEELTNRRKK